MKKTLKGLRNIFFTKTPMYVFLFVTSFCNARCKMCFNWREIENARRDEELKLDEIKKIFGNFSSIQQLTISGGEPFLRDDLPEILEFTSYANDVQRITIPTGGILSDKIYGQSRRILDRIKKDTHLRIGLSVEGVGEKHDEIMQVKGAFKNLQETYRRLHSILNSYKNLNIDISICCSVFNKGDLKELIRYCDEYFKDCTIGICLARGDTRDSSSKNVTPAEYKEIIDYLYQLKTASKANKPFAGLIDVLTKDVNNQVLQILETKKMPSRCYAYSKMIVLQSNGDVFPCECLNRKLGNLRDCDYDIRRILRQKDNKQTDKFIRGGNCCCTWECALINNIVCNPRLYPKVLRELITVK